MLPFPFINSMGLPSSRLGFVAKPEMPPHLNTLFRARPPLEYIKPLEKPKYRRYDSIISDAGNFLGLFETTVPPERPKHETSVEKRRRELKEKLKEHRAKVKKDYINWDPKENKNITMDPYRTLFVCRLDKSTDEKKLKRVFGEYGPIKNIKLIRKPNGESRNYGFIEFENIQDFKEAYKRADGIKVDGRKILVDYERGRTVPDWKPRRLGGGKGNTRRDKLIDQVMEEIAHEEEEDRKVREDVEEVKLKGTDEFKIPVKKDLAPTPENKPKSTEKEPKNIFGEELKSTKIPEKEPENQKSTKKSSKDRDYEKSGSRKRSRSREKSHERSYREKSREDSDKKKDGKKHSSRHEERRDGEKRRDEHHEKRHHHDSR